MKYLNEFRDGEIAQRMAREIRALVTRPWKIMEVCGGQTHSIIKNGIDQMLPAEVEMIHGPGCPVCVTPLELIDKALAIAARPGVIFCSFGDMLRVPGSEGDLFQVKGRGGDVRVVYSPLDAVDLAVKHPEKQVVFFGVGFETTAPANAMSVHVAKRRGLKNFSLLVSHVLVPPAIDAIMTAPENRVQAFLLAGHVCSVMGYWEYPPLAEKYRIPLVVTGFEPLDLLDGIRRAVAQLEAGRHEVENAYTRVVTREGNRAAQKLLGEVFEVTDRAWRGIGVIPRSGWRLSTAYREFDAEERFKIGGIRTHESPLCRSGDVLRGAIKPAECAAFGKECTPRHPLGATMVSSEGACAAYYNYGRFLPAEELIRASQQVSGSATSPSMSCKRKMLKAKTSSKNGGRTRHYRDLFVWQRAMGLAKNVYRLTERFPQKEIFGLQSQTRRAAVSVPSNIAEGHGRMDDGHFRQFLAISRGSLFELQTQLELCADLHYLDANDFQKLMEQCEEVARMINGLLASIAARRVSPRETDSLTC